MSEESFLGILLKKRIFLSKKKKAGILLEKGLASSVELEEISHSVRQSKGPGCHFQLQEVEGAASVVVPKVSPEVASTVGVIGFNFK